MIAFHPSENDLLSLYGRAAVHIPSIDSFSAALRVHRRNPETMLARRDERPAVLYYWAMYFTPEIGGGLALARERKASDKYRGRPIFCKAATQERREILRSLGFTDGAVYPDGSRSSQALMPWAPLDPAAARAPYDTCISGVKAGAKMSGETETTS